MSMSMSVMKRCSRRLDSVPRTLLSSTGRQVSHYFNLTTRKERKENHFFFRQDIFVRAA